MAKDKYSATWVSHSSLSDFIKCPRVYYLRNVYKRAQTGHKIQLTTPPMTLGSAVHEVLEALSILPANSRFNDPLLPKFETVWKKFSGKVGGFIDTETENKYKERGKEMLRRIEKNPEPLSRLAVKIDMDLPSFWLSPEDNILLCGKIDWLEYLPETDSVKIIDFKTSKMEEKNDSLQLPIYHLLVHNCQKRKVDSAAYWYLETQDTPTPKELPDLKESAEKILKVAKQIKLARALKKFDCPHNGCKSCELLEKIFQGEGEFVGVNSFGQDCFILPQQVFEGGEGTII